VVVIAGPDHLHADHAVLALEAGCHVFLEKPMATTVADARRIMDAAERAGKSVMTDQTVRYMYPWREMALAARNGQIGEVFFIQGDYIHDMWHYYDPQGKSHTPWRVDPLHPQNILLGGGCHPIDIMLWAMDRPVEEVFAVSNKMSAPMFPADDCYLVTLRFAGGAMGKVFVTSGCSIGEGAEQGPGGGYLAVYGTEGTLWRGKLYRRDQTARTLENTSEEYSVSGHGWGRSVVEFLDTIDGSMSNPIPPRESARTIAVCEAAFISIRTGKPEKPLWPDSDGIQ
jgi:predicted dehydrogenase